MVKVASVLTGVLLLGVSAPAFAQEQPISFFITSVGPGDGANLGGLEGADRWCQELAASAGIAANQQWRAYLSTISADGRAVVHARDRIGAGPWYNVNGVMIAKDVDDLHSDNANLTKQTIVTEKGDMVNGRGDSPNMHDILTGSNLDGTAYTGEGYTNCDNWTGSGEGSARVGHHDRTGGGENPTSWNSAHGSRGCSQANLQGTGGNGLYYCFAAGR